jgi:hypothetical protein
VAELVFSSIFSVLYPAICLIAYIMQLSNHSELISVMTELLILLVNLAIVKPGILRLPPSCERVQY